MSSYSKNIIRIVTVAILLLQYFRLIEVQAAPASIVHAEKRSSPIPCWTGTHIENRSSSTIYVLATVRVPNTNGCVFSTISIAKGTSTKGTPSPVEADVEAIWVACSSDGVVVEDGCRDGRRPLKIGDCGPVSCPSVVDAPTSLGAVIPTLTGTSACYEYKVPTWKCGWVSGPSDGWDDNWGRVPSDKPVTNIGSQLWTCLGTCITERPPAPPVTQIIGRVKYASTGIAVSNANVSVYINGTIKTVKVDNNGTYIFKNVPNGMSIITASTISPLLYNSIKVEVALAGPVVNQAPDIILNDNGPLPTSAPNPVPTQTGCSTPQLASPADGEQIRNREVTLKWSSPNCVGISGYTLHITTGNNPEDGIVFDQGVGPTQFNYIFPKDGTFYWHVAAWINGHRGWWSSRRIVINTAASVPTPTPTDCNPGTDGIVLYEHANFQGRCRNFRGDEPNFGNVSGWLNDNASSLQFRGSYIGRYEVTLYKSADYNDARGPIRGDVADLSSLDINDQASSLRLKGLPCAPNDDQVALYHERNFGGACVVLGVGNYGDAGQLAPVLNDDSWSIRVGRNVQATLYTNGNFEGGSQTFTADNADLGFTSIGNNTSSVKVEPRPAPAPPPTPVVAHCDVPNGQFCAEYYANRTLDGNPTFIRNEMSIDQNWGTKGPGNGLGVDNFSVRWLGRFSFEAGDYTFVAGSDDGISLRIDDQVIIDQWNGHPYTEYSKTVNLSGDHTIRVDYYEGSGKARARFIWKRVATQSPPTTQPSSGTPQGWTTDQWVSRSTFAIDTNGAHGGNRSVRIITTEANDARWLQRVSVKPNTTYILSGWIKTENVAHAVEVNDAGANLCVFNTGTRTSAVIGTNGWTNVSVTFKTGDSAEIQIGARLGYSSGTTTGSAWFDDIELHEQGANGLGPNVIQNGGFES